MSEREVITVRLEPEVRQRLQREAEQDHRPLAGLIRKIIHQHLEQPKVGAAA